MKLARFSVDGWESYGQIEGDRVKVELSPYDLSKGRVTYRYK